MKQTEELFANGKVTSGGGRGRALASGTAYSSGFGGFGKVVGNAIKPEIKAVAKEIGEEVKKETSSSSSSSKGSSGSKGSGGSSKVENSTSSAEDKAEDKFEETFDWVAIAIERIEREIDNLDKTVNNTYKSWSDRNTALASEIAKVGEEITLQNNAASEYLAKANAVKLTEKDSTGKSYAELIQEGALNIEDFEGEVDEVTLEKIKEYQKWYELYLECTDAAEDLKQTEAELYAQRFENVQSQYDAILQGFEHTETMLDEYISQAEAKGYIVSQKYYEALIQNKDGEIKALGEEQKKLLDKRDEYFEKQVEEYLKSHEDATRAQAEVAIKDSQQWRDMCAEIDGVTQAIESAETQTIEWGKTIRDLEFEQFELAHERMSRLSSEADFLIELMSNDKLHNDDGSLTDKGMATMGLLAQKYNQAMYEADDYGAKAKEIKDRMALDPSDENYLDPLDQNNINKYNDYIDLQRESILNAEDQKQAIKDLVEEGINLELDALQERIDKHNEELNSMKDLYEYQKKVKEQTEEIASLEKQMAAYSGDDSEEAKAKVQELRVSLEEAKESLQESEYDRYISDQSTLLDGLFLEYENILNTRLDDVDALLTQVVDGINTAFGAEGTITSALGESGTIAKALADNASSIGNTLKTEAKAVGTNLSTAMDNIWKADGSGKAVLDLYGKDFQGKHTTTNDALNSIKANVAAMVDDIDKEADTKVNSNKTTTSAKKNPTKTTTTQKKKTTTTNKKSSGGDGTPKVGDKVKFLSGKYYYDSQGKKPLGSKYQGKEVYITNINKKSWATHPYHISTGKKLGSGDLGWLKLNQISGYATGKKNFLNSELAWTQENGQEFIVRPSDGAILTPIAKGDSVLTSAASSNIWNMANSPAEFIKDNLNFGATSVPNNSNVSNNTVQHFENITFSMPNVKNYEQLLSEMQKDKSFEKLILAMTVDRIAGGSSLAKNKSIRK